MDNQRASIHSVAQKLLQSIKPTFRISLAKKTLLSLAAGVLRLQSQTPLYPLDMVHGRHKVTYHGLARQLELAARPRPALPS